MTFLYYLTEVCREKEKNKGTVCVTPSTLENPDGVKKGRSFSLKDEEMFDKSSASTLLTQPNDGSYGLSSPSKSSSNCSINEKSDIICSEDCKPLVSTNNLKMLSLLDFAGHSAYYACHHIFFSPRAFFILVVDMTKELASVASEACKENDLIYSNWTYAGNLLNQLLKI